MKKHFLKLLQNPLILRLISLGDQVLFTGGNFLLTVVLTRFYTNTDLAAYGMGLSAGLMLQNIQRNSYVIHNAVLDFKVLQSRGKKIIAEQAIAIFPLLAVMVLVALGAWRAFPDNIWSKTIAATACCYIVFSQLEFERIILVKYKKNLIPFLTAFLYVSLIATVFVVHSMLDFYELMFVLISFAILKASVLVLVVGKPDFSGGWILLRRDMRKNSLASLMGLLGYSAYTHAPVMFLGAFAAPVQAAAFVAMRSLTHILQIIIRSMDVIDKNFFKTRVSNSSRGLLKVMNTQILLYAGTSALMAGLIMIFSDPIINLVYGGKHIEFKTTLAVWGLMAVVFSATQPLESAVITKKLLNQYNHYRLWVGFLTCILLAAVGTSLGAFEAALIALAANTICFVIGYGVVVSAEKNKVRARGAS